MKWLKIIQSDKTSTKKVKLHWQSALKQYCLKVRGGIYLVAGLNNSETEGLPNLLIILTRQFYQMLPRYRKQTFDVH